MAGKYRRYQLFNFHDTDKSYLYVRIIDESTGAFLVTLPLNTLIPDREVQIQVGGDRSLHLLSMGSPTIWVYQVVNLDGKVLKQDFYQVKRGTPRLAQAELRLSSGSMHADGATAETLYLVCSLMIFSRSGRW